MLQRSTPAQRLFRWDHAVVMAGLIGITALSWVYVIYRSRAIGGMDNGLPGTGATMAQVMAWGAADFALTFLMWSVMMIAMMFPSAAPMVLTYVAVNRRRTERHPFVAPAVFAGGYVLVWAAFAAAATLAQWGSHTAALLSPMVVSTSPVLGGALLLAAGLYQWSSLKYTCLSHCRTPLGFVMSEWREGTTGALVMGLRYGAICLGCCWMLMSLLFVLGIMNLLWIAALAAFVLLEKVAPKGLWISRTTGVLLVLAGAWMLLRVLLSS